MPRPHPPEFRAEAIRLARSGERPIRATALGLGSRRAVFVAGLIRMTSMAAARKAFPRRSATSCRGFGGRIGCCARSGRC